MLFSSISSLYTDTLLSSSWHVSSMRRHPRAVLWPHEAVWSRRITSIHTLPFPWGLRRQRVFQYWSESVCLLLFLCGPNWAWCSPCVWQKLGLLIAFSDHRWNQAADIAVIKHFYDHFKRSLDRKCHSGAEDYVGRFLIFHRIHVWSIGLYNQYICLLRPYLWKCFV